jgi:hypothetical protein
VTLKSIGAALLLELGEPMWADDELEGLELTLELVSVPVEGAVLGLVEAALPATPPPVLPVLPELLIPALLEPVVSGLPCTWTWCPTCAERS